MKRIKGKVFEVSDKDNRVVYPTDKGVIKKLQRKLGVLFGLRCPHCSSKNWEYSFGNFGRVQKHCQDCNHRWGYLIRYDP